MQNKEIRQIGGKRILFIGNSFIYYGNCIIDGNAGREDNGYFYQLAKSNREDITVISHVYGGKNLKYIYENYLSREDDAFFSSIDAVFMSEAGENNANIMADIKIITDRFPNATEFFYLCHEYTHKAKHSNILDSFDKMRNIGITVVDWGGFVYGVSSSLINIPRSEIDYTRNTFIKDNKGFTNGVGTVGAGKNGDNYHQNPLSGYICALMAYCAITNRPAYGQEYRFCFDKDIHPFFDIDAFELAHYNGNTKTNMCEVMRSEREMRGIQKAIDEYIG